jgi:PD-(D/E)XK nuclease superfamily
MPTPITLSAIARTTPTLWFQMRVCGLRASLAANPAADRWVLHDPRAWLGTAFHRVMKVAQAGAPRIDVESAWNAAITQTVAAASLHPLDARFSQSERWPSYFLVRQRALSLASDHTQQAPHRSRASSRQSTAPRSSDRLLEARGGRLAGRPDHFDGTILTEYKSSLADAAWPRAAEILDGYKRQVRLYAAIIADALRVWPARARVVAASGEVLEIPIDPASCNAEADAALAALGTLNNALASGIGAEELASPSAMACSGCPFTLICPAFWRGLSEGTLRGLTDVALQGILQKVEAGPDGDLYTADILVRCGTSELPGKQSVVLRKSIHGNLALSAIGSLCRLVDGKRRPDGRIRADISTIVSPVPALPDLKNSVNSAATPCRPAIQQTI